MKFNVIGGLPRSGSTLLCNILNQNPKFHASSTSTIPQLISVISQVWSNSPELKARLELRPVETEKRMNDSIRAIIETWYGNKGAKVIFDKSRAWGHMVRLLERLYPESKAIICIRDLRNVFASVEKQHSQMPVLDIAKNPIEKTQYTRADQMFSPTGIIGLPVNGVEDIIRRKYNSVLFVPYEKFVEKPAYWIKEIYDHIGEEYFEHDLENIEATSIELDYGHYLGKYPHKGDGTLKQGDNLEWRGFVSSDIAGLIMQRYPMYNQKFGYTFE